MPWSNAESGDRHSVSSPGQVSSPGGRHFPLSGGGKQVCRGSSPITIVIVLVRAYCLHTYILCLDNVVEAHATLSSRFMER